MKGQNNRAEGRRAGYEERKQRQGVTQTKTAGKKDGGAGMENMLVLLMIVLMNDMSVSIGNGCYKVIYDVIGLIRDNLVQHLAVLRLLALAGNRIQHSNVILTARSQWIVHTI